MQVLNQLRSNLELAVPGAVGLFTSVPVVLQQEAPGRSNGLRQRLGS